MSLFIKKHIKVFGKVQGVGYRFWLQTFDIKYGVSGWVKNTTTGEVEALLVGEEEVITNLIEQCYMGPSESNVKYILVDNFKGNCEIKSFEILSTD